MGQACLRLTLATVFDIMDVESGPPRRCNVLAALDHSIQRPEGTIMAAIIPQQPVSDPLVAATSRMDEVRQILASNARQRLGQLDTLDPDQLTAGMAWLAGYSPATFDAALDAARTLENEGTRENEIDSEPYCTKCGVTIGIFLRYGNAWRHFRGDMSVASRAEPYEADHVPVVGWRPAQPLW
jgi:hypothetical protein